VVSNTNKEGTMTVTTDTVPTEVTLRGNVGRFSAQYAREKVGAALRVAPGHVEQVRIVLDYRRSQVAGGPASVEVVAELDGRTITAQAVASTMREAIDVAVPRLRRQLVHARTRTWSRSRR
jgi:ribosome-associated translation inhibitor RaiA